MLASVRLSTRRLLPLCSRAIRAKTCRTISTDPADYFHYTRAIVGSIPNSIVGDSLRMIEPDEAIDLEKAKKDHAVYVNELKKLIPHVVQIPPDEEFPDMVFVEDPTVVQDGKGFITNMTAPSRKRETRLMRPVLEELGLQIIEADDPDAQMDGGDVLFTGREFLVGLSRRTNAAGIACLQKAFPEWPVTAITVSPGVLHLKSMSSMCGIDTLAISGSEAGQIAWREIVTKSHFGKYKKVEFPDDNGANCLFINGTVLHPPEHEYPGSYKVWQTVDLPKVELSNSELAKADGSLTCNSVRIQ